MFSDRERDRIENIVEESGAVADYLAGVDFEQFARDRRTRDAVERCTERVIEAAIQLGADTMARVDPGIQLHELRGLGNRLRHVYHRIDVDVVWNTACHDLPPLRRACAAALGLPS